MNSHCHDIVFIINNQLLNIFQVYFTNVVNFWFKNTLLVVVLVVEVAVVTVVIFFFQSWKHHLPPALGPPTIPVAG